jgi:hypothetical protein
MARTARSRSADLLAHPHRTGCGQQHDAGVVNEPFAEFTAAHDQAAHRGGRPDVGGGAGDQRLAGQTRKRRQLRGLPHHCVPAHQRYRGVPCPHRNREVERGDHARHTERMPGLDQPMPGALRCDGSSVELARQADGESADVDHFLHFAQGLGGDLSHLDRHQCGQVVLVCGEQLAEPGHQCAAYRGRCTPPSREGLGGIGDRVVGVVGCGLGDGEQHLAGDRRAGGQAVPTRLVEAGLRRTFSHDGRQGITCAGAPFVCAGHAHVFASWESASYSAHGS